MVLRFKLSISHRQRWKVTFGAYVQEKILGANFQVNAVNT